MRIAVAMEYPAIGSVAGPVRSVTIVSVPDGTDRAIYVTYMVTPQGAETKTGGAGLIGNTDADGRGKPPTATHVESAAATYCEDAVVEWAGLQPGFTRIEGAIDGTRHTGAAVRERARAWFPNRGKEIDEQLP